MTIHFGDSTSIATATGLGANMINSAQVVKTDAEGFTVAWGGTSGDAIYLDYTASSSSNKLLIMCHVTVGLDFGGRIGAELYIGGSRESGITADTSGNRQRRTSGEHAGHENNISNIAFNYLKTSPSTSSTRYSVKLGQGDNGTRNVYINKPHGEPDQSYQMRGTSSITILELGA
tara:strand:- start:393 stop:917 length:525 start_codon:yes stop_codon:yes gene_type:complete